MKWAYFIILFALMINTCLALSTDLKKSYSGKETIIFEIKGNILNPVLPGQIYLQRENTEIPIETKVEVLDERTFAWFVAPEIEGNYTIFIKKIFTSIDGVSKEIDFQQNFSLAGKSNYTIKPGVISSKNDFQIEITLNQDEKKIIPASFPSSKNLELKPGKNIFSISISDIPRSKFTQFQVGSYLIPAEILKEQTGMDRLESKKSIIFYPGSIKRSESIGKFPKFSFSIKNEANRSIERITLEYNSTLMSIFPDEQFNLEPNKTRFFNITFKQAILGMIKENVAAKYGRETAILTLELAPIGENETGKNFTSVGAGEYYCAELEGGKKCGSAEKCSGESKGSLDGECCIGECSAKKSSGSLIGWIIGIIVLAILWYIYSKYKKAKVNDKEILKDLKFEGEKEPVP